MKKIAIILLTLFALWSCTKDGPSGPNVDDFDREAILVNWSDNIIIPSFTAFSGSADQLHSDASAFAQAPTLQNLEILRNSWKSAYLAFQHVSMFEMGKAMELRFRDNLNIYPTDTTEIETNIMEGNYNLELSSLNDSQGFPALDYMLNGLGANDTETLAFYTTHENSNGYLTYLTDLTARIQFLSSEVLTDWTSGYRDEFVSNSGNGANSSLDMMVNDYIYYYEKHLRAGKIGIPAGVFSGSPLSTHVEAYYSDAFSKSLFNEALNASQNFFNGTHFESNTSGESLKSYLDFLNTMKDGTDLATLINNQFDAAREEAKILNDNFAEQVESNNNLMLSTYDQLQLNVVYMKVDMLQALNINVDYVDADGD
ncbi:MAG: imelysin family protein [Gracilimonas sp.]|uniref:imelysin family protein n=1 Tax=Gracilimonas sp. TaxID=1974203 RepID=UPI0019C5742E|nr:imelysin family protein [Gracilimonas sp.]MBD3616615.1 imelysin family protein [Gracilimonas sp.]